MEITYYNEKNNLIPFVNELVPSDSLASLRYMMLELEFFYDAFSPPDIPGWLRDDPKNRIILWRYFINMYL